MGGFSGLDPEAVDRLAVALRTQAHVLAGIGTSVDGLVEETGWLWQGPRSEEFAGWWWQQHRPALLAAVKTLDGLAQSALNNAQDQRRVSGDRDPSSAGQAGSAWSRLGVGLQAVAEDSFFRSAAAGTGALGLLGTVPVIGRYSNRYRSVAAFVSGRTVKGWQAGTNLASRLTHYKTSPVLQHLQPGTALGRTVDSAGRLFSGISIAADTHKAADSAASGDLHTLGTSTADATSTALKTSKNPAAYIGGVAMSAWSEASKEAVNVRWDEGVPSPLGENWSTIWVPALKETGAEFTNRLPKILL